MNVKVQEFDGNYSHSIQIEDLVSTHELACHSKIRKYVFLQSYNLIIMLLIFTVCTCRAKKRKVPLQHKEEIEIDISNLEYAGAIT